MSFLKNWQPVDIIAVSVTLTLCLVFTAWTIALIIRGTVISDTKADLITGVYGSLLSLVSMFVGAKIQKRMDKK